MRSLHGLRGMRFYSLLFLLQLPVAVALEVACVLFMLRPPTSFEPASHGPLWLLGGCLVAATVMFWRSVDPQLNRLDLDLLSNGMHYLLPAIVIWYAVALGTFALVLAVPEAASSGWSFVPLLAIGAVVVLLCAAAFILASVLVTRERRAIARARAVLDSFRSTCAPAELERIQSWVDWRVGDGSSRPPVMIRGPYFPGLMRRAWYDAEAFDWERELQAALPKVREEVLAVYGADRQQFHNHAYPGSGGKNWSVFTLFRNNEKLEANCARCPETTRLVERITGGVTRDVMVSLLGPDAYIAPHRDSGNIFLTGHFGIVIPEECGLRVGEETRVWSEGRSLTFDTTFEHEAWNRGKGMRMVLLYEFLHPDMSAVERRFFTTLFRTNAPQAASTQAPGQATQGAA